MKVLLSPAKSLDYKTDVPFTATTQPIFLKESKVVNEVVKDKSPQELMELMKISSNLAQLNWERNQNRTFKFSDKRAVDFKQAVYAFNGDVYTGLDAYSLSEKSTLVMCDKLLILSGLYGVLRPTDSIEAYRLEMGTKMSVANAKNLHEYWKPILLEYLNKEVFEGDIIVNLASNEYFGAVDAKKINATIVTPDFKELREGKLKVISFFAKKARGLMARYIFENNITDIEGLKNFNVDGYVWSEAESKGNNLIFTR